MLDNQIVAMNDFNPFEPDPALAELLKAKRLGDYLVEAGLLTPAQVQVALNDRAMTDLRFGEIVAVRGWVKQQTIDYFMEKIVLPERQARSQQIQAETQSASMAAIDPADEAAPTLKIDRTEGSFSMLQPLSNDPESPEGDDTTIA